MEALRQKFFYLPLLMGCTLLSACNAQSNSSSEVKQSQESTTERIHQSYHVEKVATFDEPWAMTELVDGRLLITERRGN